MNLNGMNGEDIMSEVYTQGFCGPRVQPNFFASAEARERVDLKDRIHVLGRLALPARIENIGYRCAPLPSIKVSQDLRILHFSFRADAYGLPYKLLRCKSAQLIVLQHGPRQSSLTTPHHRIEPRLYHIIADCLVGIF